MLNTTPPELWGKDHWSTYMYCVLRAVDHGGKLANHQLRLDGVEYPTRLNDGTAIGNHSDMDCIDDFERLGLMENAGTGVNRLMKLSDRGWDWALHLMKQKASGLSFHQCRPPEEG